MIRLFCFAVTLCFSIHAFSPYYSGGRLGRWDFNFPGYHTNIFNPTTKSIRYFLGPETPSVVNRAAELNAIRASFAQWQAIPGAVLKFEEGGVAPVGSVIDLDDKTNVVYWTKTTRVNGDDISARAAYTFVGFDSENRIVAADTALNGVTFSWFTDFNNTTAGSQFVESIALHEIGHFIGLDHSPLGGATVKDGGPGVGPAAGLSSDEIAAARFLYPSATIASQVGSILGTVRMNGVGIRGAIVIAENSQGLAISATPTDTAGNYNLAALPPGAYNVHVSPLDPDTAAVNTSLFRSQDIAGDFGASVTAFKPTENFSATINAGAAVTQNFNVTAGEPALRIQQIIKPGSTSATAAPVRYAVGVNPGTTMFVGVTSSTIPPDAILSITGDGITMGPMIYEPNRFFGNQHLLQASITISSNATPGLRTIVVRRGSDLAYANGYLEIFAPTPDYNFDGLDDRFQRRYFPLFTAPESAPASDPDGDHFSNAFEALTDSNPTDGASYSFLIERVEIIRGLARVSWKSDIGKQYQLYGKEDVAGATWQLIGGPITATSNLTVQSDVTSSSAPKFYRLKLVP